MNQNAILRITEPPLIPIRDERRSLPDQDKFVFADVRIRL